MINHRAPDYVCVKTAWCDEARDGLRDTFYENGERIAEGVRSGAMELWRVNGASWAVTQLIDQTIFLWCYQGRDVVPFILKLVDVARAQGLAKVSFFSQRKGAARAWKQFNPRVWNTDVPGEKQYMFEVSML
jgi:hypothetical protein